MSEMGENEKNIANANAEEMRSFFNMISTEWQKSTRSRKKTSIQDYIWRGLIYFMVIVASMVFAFVVMRFSVIMDFFSRVFVILKPIIWGLIIAYLLNPIMKKFEKLGYKLNRKTTADKKTKGRIRMFSIFASVIVAILLLTVLLYAIIPDLIVSVSGLVRDLPNRVQTFTIWLNSISIDERIDQVLQESIVSTEKYLENWIKVDLLQKADSYVVTLTDSVFGVIGVIKNVFIGLIVSIYLLANKERFIGQIKKVLYSVFSEKTTNGVLEIARDSDRIFIGFLSGKIIDSCIIGLLCFIILSILHIPYTLVVSVMVGVTNIIPFFGPYIGGIPSALLILLTDTKSGIIFILVIVILQQLDGNLIGPKILGNSTGLSAFWVIFAILLGSGLFGFPGMIFGVPTFAVIYHILTKSVNERLKRKNLPVETEQYVSVHSIEKKQLLYVKSENNERETEEDKKKTKVKNTENRKDTK